ncbi:MAG: YigZ family protein, partial [Clostridia bacterium]|nr:YigZ family protein [Clostridia bacterium]
MSNDSYRTLSCQAQDEYIVKHSRFIGYAKPVKTEKEAQEFIAEISKKHWDAKHNVYAYSIREGGIKRYSDDGEPQGTAGMPVLNVILQEDITDCVVVVTRYFGGILLGGGGLVRAYTHSAKIGIDAAGIITLSKWTVCKISCDYTFYGKLETFIRDFGGVIENTDFGENVTLEYRIEKGTEDAFDKKLKDLTNGKISFEITDEVIADKK